MKVSVSLPDDDVRFVDDYASEHGYPSRSAVLQKAVRMLRANALGGAYADAWAEWEQSGEAELWDQVAGDGIADAR